MLYIDNNQIMALTAPITSAEEALLPLTHICGVAYWIVDSVSGEIRKRTEAEIQAIYIEEHPEARDQCLQTLNVDLHAYLTERGYDEGTQLSFQAIYIDLQELPELTEAQAQAKVKIRQAWDFVRGIVLPHYYQWKAQLEVIEDFLNYSWDFHALDAADPCVALREIMLLLQEA